MIRRILIPATLVFMAACATTPPPEMPVDAFEAAMTDAKANPSPASVDIVLSALLARDDLNQLQRSEILFVRAEKRQAGAFNLPGAVADLDAFLAARPEDLRVADAQRLRELANLSVEGATDRLSRLQNLRNWFDDKVALGALSEAAARYQASGLTPTAQQTYTLQEAGYVCSTTESEAADPLHTYGPEPDYATGLVWCEALPDT